MSADIGKKIKYLRKSKGLTQEDLSLKLGGDPSRSTLSNYEIGRKTSLEIELKEIEKNLFTLEQQKKQTTTSEEIQGFLYNMLNKTENLNDKVLKQLFDCFVENIIITTHEIKIKLRVFPAPDFAYKNNIATPIVRLYAEIHK